MLRRWKKIMTKLQDVIVEEMKVKKVLIALKKLQN